MLYGTHLTLDAQAMASLGHAPRGREGGRGSRHTHWPAASSSGASVIIMLSTIDLRSATQVYYIRPESNTDSSAIF